MSVHTFLYKHGSFHLECEIDYEPAQLGAREIGTGLQLEPDYDDMTEVLSVSIISPHNSDRIDITDIIQEWIIDEIKDTFLNQELEDWDYDYK